MKNVDNCQEIGADPLIDENTIRMSSSQKINYLDNHLPAKENDDKHREKTTSQFIKMEKEDAHTDMAQEKTHPEYALKNATKKGKATRHKKVVIEALHPQDSLRKKLLSPFQNKLKIFHLGVPE